MRSGHGSTEVMVEVARGVDEALVAAMAQLLPQLDPSAPIPHGLQLQALVDAPASLLLLAHAPVVARSIVGMLTLSIVAIPSGCHAWIDDVVVDAAWRGRGVAALLVGEALRLAASRGAVSVDLTSRPERSDANRLYQRLGFVRRETNVYRHELARDASTT
ncbi:MAG: GNAT family N-acetyltransferase [Gemmatimonadota bacterium]